MRNVQEGKLVRISVVIATHNQREYLLEALSSVKNQSYAAFEIIVVCDGCDDGTEAAVSARFPDVQIISQPSLGKGIARNTGILAANGEWIALLDHDDFWHRDKLQFVAEAIARTGTSVAIGHDVVHFSNSGDLARASVGGVIEIVASRYLDCQAWADSVGLCEARSRGGERVSGDLVGTAAVMNRRFATTSAQIVRRDVALRSGGFNPMQFNGEDWSFAVNVSRFGPWLLLPEKLTFMRTHLQSGTRNPCAGLMLLATYIHAWFAGQAFGHVQPDLEFLSELSSRKVYRNDCKIIFWDAVRRRNIKVARLVLRAASLLLPRWRDRVFVVIPFRLVNLFSRLPDIPSVLSCRFGR